MILPDQTEAPLWRDGVPVSVRFDDPYFSLANGLAETCHVFLAGNDLPARFVPGFRVAELGFGTGLNLLATARAWAQAGIPGEMSFTSFEAYPMPGPAMAQALAAFPDLADLAASLVAQWTGVVDGVGTAGVQEIMLLGCRATVILGDARTTVPQWLLQADAWFLDGFSPAKNPELWDPTLLAHVAHHTAPGGTAATYSAAGAVRRALQDAGFDVTRAPGHGRKRHMTRAVLIQPAPNQPAPNQFVPDQPVPAQRPVRDAATRQNDPTDVPRHPADANPAAHDQTPVQPSTPEQLQ